MVFYEKPTEFFVRLKGAKELVIVTASRYRNTGHSFEFEMVFRMPIDERRELFLHVPPPDEPQDRVLMMVVSFPKGVVDEIGLAVAG